MRIDHMPFGGENVRVLLTPQEFKILKECFQVGAEDPPYDDPSDVAVLDEMWSKLR